MSKTVVVIPAYNEGDMIRSTIKSVLNTGIVDEIVVVDDGSTDKTSEVALECGAKVIRNQGKCGKGKALMIGVNSLDDKLVSCVVFLDADIGYGASEIKKIIKPVQNGEADMAIAGFKKALGIGGYGFLKGFASFGTKALTGRRFKWPLSGQRAITMESLKKVGKIADGYGVEVGLTLDWIRNGYNVVEVETSMVHIATGRNLKGFVHRGNQFVGVAKAFLPRAFQGRKDKESTKGV